MSANVTNVRIAGLGGMGVLKASRILAELFFRRGNDVKKAEVHGMSQRGGSVCSDVRFGEKVFSPMIPAGQIDYLVLLQDDQLPLYRAQCSKRTVVLSASAIDLDKLGPKRCLNVAMLGMLSRYLESAETEWLTVIHDVFPENVYTMNAAAFQLGRRSA